jgi:hypothetical protein
MEDSTVNPKPPYDHTAVYPMPIVSVPQRVALEGDLPGGSFFLSELPGDAWWALYEVRPDREPMQLPGYPAISTTEVRAWLTGYATDARGMGHAWPGLATSFDPDAQVVYVRYGAWLWTPAGAEAFARIA